MPSTTSRPSFVTNQLDDFIDLMVGIQNKSTRVQKKRKSVQSSIANQNERKLSAVDRHKRIRHGNQ